MRTKALGLGTLLGAAALAVAGAAAALAQSASGAGCIEIALASGPDAARPRPDEPRAVAASQRTGSARSFAPGYRRERRRRVRPAPRRRVDPARFVSGFSALTNGPPVTIVLGLYTGQRPALEVRSAERLRAAAELRRLPVPARLERARAALRLTSGQVELLERAVGARGGGAPDAGRFEELVAEALDLEQRRRWVQEGYRDSFGQPVAVAYQLLELKAAEVVVAPRSGSATLHASSGVVLTVSPSGAEDGP